MSVGRAAFRSSSGSSLVGWSCAGRCAFVRVCLRVTFVCAFVSAFVCSFRGLFARVLSWVEIYITDLDRVPALLQLYCSAHSRDMHCVCLVPCAPTKTLSAVTRVWLCLALDRAFPSEPPSFEQRLV